MRDTMKKNHGKSGYAILKEKLTAKELEITDLKNAIIRNQRDMADVRLKAQKFDEIHKERKFRVSVRACWWSNLTYEQATNKINSLNAIGMANSINLTEEE